jgi:AbrB family looped-hinge helix DNA binding protein
LTLLVKNRTLYFMKSVISSKGQVTVPAEIREKLGLLPGTVVTFELSSQGALLKKGRTDLHPVDVVYGKLKLRQPVDELVDEMRGPRPRTR